MKIYSVNQGIAVEFNYNPKYVEIVRGAKQRRYNAIGKYWLLDKIYDNIKTIRQLEAEGFQIAETVRQWVEEEENKYNTNIEASKRASADISIEGLRGDLRPFQKAGVEYAINNKRVIIADEMGLGKTIQAIGVIQAKQLYPALIVCPASLKLNWRNECQRWLPEHISVYVIHGSVETMHVDSSSVVIANYDILDKNEKWLKKIDFKIVVFDECHYAKNNKAKRTQSAMKLAANKEYIIGLTGTPILNRPAELIAPLKILRRLDEFGGWYNYARRYCKAYKGRFGWDLSGADNLDELNEKLRATCYIRRRKQDVLRELPDKIITRHYVELSNIDEYNYAEAELIEYLKKEAIKDREFLESIAHLPQDEQIVAKAERMKSKEEKIRRAEHLVRIEALKQVVARGKLDGVYEFVDNVLEEGDKIVIFANHKAIIEDIAARYNCKQITGDTSIDDRQRAVEDFQSNDNTKVIVLNIKAGGVGLTLTAASKVAFVELGWTPAEHQQAEDRIHRIGQKNVANVYYFLSEGTIDDYIYGLLETKRSVVNAATEGELEAERTSIMTELINILINK